MHSLHTLIKWESELSCDWPKHKGRRVDLRLNTHMQHKTNTQCSAGQRAEYWQMKQSHDKCHGGHRYTIAVIIVSDVLLFMVTVSLPLLKPLDHLSLIVVAML